MDGTKKGVLWTALTCTLQMHSDSFLIFEKVIYFAKLFFSQDKNKKLQQKKSQKLLLTMGNSNVMSNVFRPLDVRIKTSLEYSSPPTATIFQPISTPNASDWLPFLIPVITPEAQSSHATPSEPPLNSRVISSICWKKHHTVKIKLRGCSCATFPILNQNHQKTKKFLI